jgi:hypothetical protein
VGIAIFYGLDGPGIESQCGRDFPQLSRSALGPSQPPIQWVPGLWEQSGLGVELTTHPHLVPGLKKEQELYLYSRSGPSWPALGRTLALPVC